MCGIVGAITSFNSGFTTAEANAVQDLLFMDTLRGTDSTGVFYGCTDGAIQIHKEASVGWDFLRTNEWRSTRSELIRHGKWIVGHNRAATRGSKKDENAHPFYVEDGDRSIILCQNGTYRGDHSSHAKTEVDTEAMAHTIVKAESLEKAFQSMDAAFAFVWYDLKDKSLHMIRNSERPLAIASTKSGAVFFASEKEMLQAALSRNSLPMDNPVVNLKQGIHIIHSFKKGKHEISTEELDIDYKKKVFPLPTSGPTSTSDKEGYVSKREQWLQKREEENRSAIATPGQAMLLLAPPAVLPIRTREETTKVGGEVLAAKTKQRRFLVEALDYVPYVETQDTSKSLQYWVFGKINTPLVDDPLDGEYVAWTVEGKEKDVVTYISDNMFRVSLDYLYTRTYNDPGKILTTIMVDDVELLHIVKTPEPEDAVPN